MNFTASFIVKPNQKVDLSRIDPAQTRGFKNKAEATRRLEKNIDRLVEIQSLLYAEHKRALLIVLQALDGGGKDGTIRHVMAGVNPLGCKVTAFKIPSEEELAHDFLWRVHKAVPGKGEIGIFNRSHYEDVLVVRVHKLVEKSVWSRRYHQINLFEQILSENDVHILKFFLHISKDEQKKRLDERRVNPRKFWKFNPADLTERKHWDEYMKAYEEALSRCSTAHAPWFIVPADRKWFRNLVVSQIIIETLQRLDMKFPIALASARAS